MTGASEITERIPPKRHGQREEKRETDEGSTELNLRFLNLMLVAVAALVLAMSGWLAAAPALAQTVPDAPTGPAARTVAVYTVTLEVARHGHLAETGLHQ